MIAVATCAALSGSFALAAGHSASSDFLLYCSGCHGQDGRGGGEHSGIPDFQNFVGAFAGDDGGRTYVLHVPGVVNTSLDNARIAAVINYIMRTWGGTSLRADFVAFTEEEVTKRRARSVPDVVALRRQVARRLHAQGIATADYPWP
jgi:mono/diheme cytochrome c family protein